jgi:lysophospholipase L1-like esterase
VIVVIKDQPMTRAAALVQIAVAVGLATFVPSGLVPSGLVAGQQPLPAARWITAWGTSQQGLGTTEVTNATVRMIARVAIAGEAVRIRLDNAFGDVPVSIGSAYVGQRIQGAGLAEGSNRQVLFARSAGVTIPAGGSVVSDPVSMTVLARQDLAVSLYVPAADMRPSQHGSAQVTSYLTANGSGDRGAEEAAAAFTGTTTSLFWLKAIDVLSSSSTGSIVAFGDSITDGTCSTLDAHDRWEDLLVMRLAFDADGRGNPRGHKAVVNEGIGGNTVTRDGLQPAPASPPGLERLERDVLGHHGVTHVVLFMGTNDLRREAPAAQVIAGMQDLITRVKAHGPKIVGVTIIPRHNRPAAEDNTGWNAEKTRRRNEVNRWIRTQASFDAIIDFDQVVRDPEHADLMFPPFNCGDGIHPSPRGYYEMGRSIPLDLFR